MLRNKKRVIWGGIVGIALVVVMGMFLWGKLFAYSPVHPGFIKQELEHCIIYRQTGAEIVDLEKLDSWIPAVERFHELKFTQKPVLFFFRDRKSYLQRVVTKARFYAYPKGPLMISPWAVKESKTGKISMEIYIKHELSHTILYQNMGLWAVVNYPQWLMEGIAVYSTDQMGTSFYPGREETRRLIKQGVFLPPKFFKTRKEKTIPINIENAIAFDYSEFACFVTYLIELEGKDKFMEYMKALLKGKNHDEVFHEVYNYQYDESIQKFRTEF